MNASAWIYKKIIAGLSTLHLKMELENAAELLIHYYDNHSISIFGHWTDCKPEGPLFSAKFVCLCVSDWHFYPSALTDFDETWSKGPYCDLVWPRP